MIPRARHLYDCIRTVKNRSRCVSCSCSASVWHCMIPSTWFKLAIWNFGAKLRSPQSLSRQCTATGQHQYKVLIHRSDRLRSQIVNTPQCACTSNNERLNCYVWSTLFAKGHCSFVNPLLHLYSCTFTSGVFSLVFKYNYEINVSSFILRFLIFLIWSTPVWPRRILALFRYLTQLMSDPVH